MTFRPGILVSSLVLVALAVRCSLAQDPPFREILGKIKPKSPRESLDCLRVREGFRVELACAEPLVTDPIAIDWGPDGRLWVVDMGDYPTGGDGSEAAGGCPVLGGHRRRRSV